MDREIGLLMGPRVIGGHSKFIQWRGIPDRSQKYMEGGFKVGQASLKKFEHSETEI